MPIIKRRNPLIFVPPPSPPKRNASLNNHSVHKDDGYPDCIGCGGSGRNSKGGTCYPCSVRYAADHDNGSALRRGEE